MLNDVIFNDEISALGDWNIVLVDGGVDIPLPTPKIITIDIKGADGNIDLTEVLTGHTQFEKRVIKLTFSMMDTSEYHALISKISNYLHGKTVKFTLTHDADWYYVGRASVEKWSCVKRTGTVVLRIECDPYKYATKETVVSVNVNNDTLTFVLPNSRKIVCPTLKVTGTPTLVIDGVEYPLTSDITQHLNFILKEGNNIIQVKGNGALTITYRQGCL